MTDIYLIPIEPINTRYTREWYDHIPIMIENFAKRNNQDVNIIVVDGEQVPPTPSPGAFLDFAATNIWKSSQLIAIAERFRQGLVKPNSKFLFTDAWNPTVLQLRYMSELNNIPIEIHSLWHSGAYDKHDFLGRLIGNKPWVRNAEKSMFHCYTTNWFATNFHMDMFINNMFGPFTREEWEPDFEEVKSKFIMDRKIDLTGWPMEYLFDVLEPYTKLEKKPQICFPHRIAPEKQLDIFKDLAASMPEYNWVVCQDRELTKHEYHTILGESQMVFSANLQETYGISCIEGLICGAMPLVPDRLSYSEMYTTPFKYPSEWTASWEDYQSNKRSLIAYIQDLMGSYPNGEDANTNSTATDMQTQIAILDHYVRATPMIEALLV